MRNSGYSDFTGEMKVHRKPRHPLKGPEQRFSHLQALTLSSIGGSGTWDTSDTHRERLSCVFGVRTVSLFLLCTVLLLCNQQAGTIFFVLSLPYTDKSESAFHSLHPGTLPHPTYSTLEAHFPTSSQCHPLHTFSNNSWGSQAPGRQWLVFVYSDFC